MEFTLGSKRSWVLSGVVAVLACALVAPAGAVRQPDHLKGRPQLEVASGPRVREYRRVTWDKPGAATALAWEQFLAKHGPGGWRALFDAQTGVPLRIYGAGIAVPGASADGQVALRAARAFLAEHIELVAPGASPGDFVLVGEHDDGRMRTLGFAQTSGGMAVVGGQVSFRFKNDRLFVVGSEAIPFVRASAPALVVGDATLEAVASGWLLGDVAAEVSLRAIDGPMLLPLVGDTGTIEVRTVMRVTLDARAPIGRWDVYVDAVSGAPVAREQTLRFASATINFDVPDRWPQNGRKVAPAGKLTVSGGTANATDAAGVISFGGAMATLGFGVVGPFIRVVNDAGAALTFSESVSDGGSVTKAFATTEFSDAQLNAFIAANIVKDRLRIITPGNDWLNGQQRVTVNIADTCNAFSDGDSINFFRAGGGCGNTGRLADVVYHESGHSIHANSIIPGAGDFDGALSEGVSDYLAATIVNDAGMGRGFFNTNEPLRHCDPPNGENRWPEDQGEIHTTGIIICGALWDLRKNLVGAYGESDGVAHADQMYLSTIQRASDIPSSYVEVLAADDDDGNIDNGTPNKCLIDEAFARHGLAEPGADTGPGVRTPVLEGLHLTVPVVGSNSACPGKAIEGAVLNWELRNDPNQKGSIPMTLGAEAFTGNIPGAPDGSVIRYQVVVTLEDMSTVTFPDNRADPFYELFIGEVVPIYCSDFEGDVQPEGWQHALAAGTPGDGADDWQWGTPAGTSGSGDPKAAYSGAKAWGNDLGGGNFNGQYQADKTNYLLSPPIDVSGHTHVRLQYRRWLNVEDGSFDQAKIYVDDQVKWQNSTTGAMPGDLHHTDKEWRFHDLELDDVAADGTVQVKFELDSDQGLNMGGWTLDDFCIMAYLPAECGDGEATGGEQCDDGEGNSDSAPDACRSDCTAAGCGDGVVDSGEQCDDGGTADGDGCSASCQAEAGPFCGNGTVDEGEACDDGNAIEDDACTSSCEKGPGGGGDGEGGCGCRAGGSGTPAGGAALGALALALLLGGARRRRRL